MSREPGEIRVLHVDDDREFLDLAGDMLPAKNDRLTLTGVQSPAAARERLDRDDVDCVVSDYEMPEETGIEFLEGVRADHEDLPFILFTGKGSEAIAGEALRAGVSDYIQKGAGIEQFALLANRIENAVDQYRAERRAARLQQMRTLVSDVNQALVRADSRQEIETEVTGIIARSERYGAAWIGEVDDPDDGVLVRTGVGLAAAEENGHANLPSDHPVAASVRAAMRRGTITVTREVPTEGSSLTSAVDQPVSAVAAVPLTHDDSTFGVLVVYATRTDLDGNEQAMLEGLGDDIGHALHAQSITAELAAERDFIDQALEALTDVFYVVNADGTIRRWNQRVPEVTGYTDDEIAEMHAIEFFPEDERDRIMSAIERTLTEGEARVEADYLTADGERLPYEFTGARLTDPDGTVEGLVGVARDISERQRRARRLEQERDRFRSLFEHFPEPTVAVRFEEGEPVARAVNSAFTETFGHAGETMVGRSLNDVIVPEDLSAEADAIDRTVREEQIAREVTRMTEDGRRTFLFRNVPLTDDEEYDQFGFYIDVSEQKARERDLERQNERLDKVASMLSHDLRHPLNVIVGRTELLAAETDSEHLQAIQRAHDRMETMIDDVLALARYGEPVEETQRFDLEALAREAWDTVDTGGASLELSASGTIRGNRSRVQQLLENLIANAVTHGTAGTVEIGTTSSGFFVADDGSGVPPDRREAVFDPGFTTADTGSGVGLAIVAEVAAAHGWEVEVAESASGGARFEVTGVDLET